MGLRQLLLTLAGVASAEAFTCTARSPALRQQSSAAAISSSPHVLRLSGGATAVHDCTASAAVTVVPTEPIEGQKPGTSGLRKKTKVFQGEKYLENFVQSLFDSLPAGELAGTTLVVSGDGRYHNAAAIQTICRMAAANGVARVWVGRGGLLSTPAASAIIREREGGAAYGGIVLTASHNPGGPEADFGIKYNVQNGGPALESLTDAVYERTGAIKEFKLCEGLPAVDLQSVGRHVYAEEGGAPFFEVEVVDPAEDYLVLMRKAFDLDALKALLARDDMSFVFDGMHGVAGPYAASLLGEVLGVHPDSLLNCEPKEDFGGGHPDPNLTYAAELVARMGLTADGKVAPAADAAPVLGAAADGDADRNMILGRGFFVTPSDSLAVIAAHAHLIPWFKNEGGLKALARSMPTSGAVDLVAKDLGVPFFETPTGWKFFGNLMDSHLLGGENLSPLICGEESFGTGSSHVREKDGLWAVLAWLSILAHHNKDTAVGSLVGVGDIVRAHWRKYGRNFYTRYDYEQVDSGKANEMVARLVELGLDGLGAGGAAQSGFVLSTVDEFAYTDPVDGSYSANQGVRLLFADGSRVIFRLSGTGSVGATVRMYIERYQPPDDAAALEAETADALAPLVDLALSLSQVREITGRDEPTVIT